MAKFNLNQILNDASKAAGKGGDPIPRPDESRLEKISVFDLVPSEENFYSMREIDELKAAIEIAGKVLQNLVVVPLDVGKYKVISGHRRRLASLALVEEGKPKYEFLPCDVEPTEDAAEDQEVRDGLMLIATNSQREKTAWDKVEEVRFLREVLEKARTKPRFVAVLQNIAATAFGGAEVQTDGTRDFIAKVLHTSTTQIGRYDAINRNLCPDFKAELKEDRINISTAYELSGLPAEDQKAAFDEYRANGEISIRTARERKQDPPPPAEVKPEEQDRPSPETLQPGCNNLETMLRPNEPQDAPQGPAEPPEEADREESPPNPETPPESRPEPKAAPPTPFFPPMDEEQPAEEEIGIAEYVEQQISDLIDLCASMENAGDASRNWGVCIATLSSALAELTEGRDDE